MATDRKIWDNLIAKDEKLGQTSREIYDQISNLIAGLASPQEWLLSTMGYAGFDVMAMRQLIMQKGICVQELFFMVCLFLIRGNNIARIKDSTGSDEVVKTLKSLETRLNLKSKAQVKTKNVTLSRIAIAFPEVVAVILDKVPELPGAVSLADIRTVLGYAQYPSLSRQPALACMLPKLVDGIQDLLNVFLMPNMMVSEVINAGNAKWTAMTNAQKLETTMPYQRNAYNSFLFKEDERIYWATKLNILNRDQTINIIWVKAAEVAKAKLTAAYGSGYR